MGFLLYDIIFFVVFCAIAGFFLLKHKKKIKRQGIVILYRTKFGLKFIDKLAKRYPRFFNFLSVVFIAIAFVGMAAIIFMFALGCYKLAVMPVKEAAETPFPIFPLVPWIRIPGLPTLYFTYWIIAIFILALVHEGCHGIFARVNKIRVKSSGFGFFGPLPVAFVEPDEKQLIKKSAKAQLSVFSAGPVANFIAAFVTILIISLILNPLFAFSAKDSKILVTVVENASPAYAAGINKGDIIKIDGISTIANFGDFVLNLKPNQTINIQIENETESRSFDITTVANPTNETRGYIGIGISPKLEGINLIFPILFALFSWIYLTNLFVGLINLLPLWVFDGQRLFFAAALSLTKSKKKALKATKAASSVSLFLVFLMIFIWIVRRVYGI